MRGQPSNSHTTGRSRTHYTASKIEKKIEYCPQWNQDPLEQKNSPSDLDK